MKVHKTWDWSPEKINRYWPDIMGAFEQLRDRFPDDVAVEGLIQAGITGEKALWLVLDGAEFVALAMAQIRPTQAGCKIATVMDVAGKNPKAFLPVLIPALEEWAKENGADYYAVEGRQGWQPLVKDYGYKPYAVQWRKKVR